MFTFISNGNVRLKSLNLIRNIIASTELVRVIPVYRCTCKEFENPREIEKKSIHPKTLYYTKLLLLPIRGECCAYEKCSCCVCDTSEV